MRGDREPVFCRGFFLQCFNFRRDKFCDRAAVKAHHVVVVLVVEGVFIKNAAVADIEPLHESAVDEQTYGSVNGGDGNPVPGAFEFPV